ncbi:MAG: glycosyltransferase family 4 protein [Cyanothece sp. SIO1E1]|nr:glycosyltransferase family 4 protein [Cyanothece sp. SIO1E1]
MRPTIGFLLKTYPKLSETFILNEILELERQGINLHIFSLRQRTDRHAHPGVAQVKAPVTYLPTLLPKVDPADEARLIETQVKLFNQDEAVYMKALEFYLSRQEDRHLNEFMQGAYLADQLQRLGITHLHVHFANVPAATAEIAQVFYSVPYSITAHAKDIYLSDPAALDRRISKAEFVLTCTDFNRRHLEHVSTSSTPIHLSYHGLDLPRFQPQPRTPNDVPLILSVGRFCEKKGFPYLLEALSRLKTAGLPFRSVIVGYGELEQQIRQQISALGLDDRVSLVGKLTQDQLVGYYQRADAFVLPCLVTDSGDRDGIPNVLLEAMAMEIPVVSTNISGISELVTTNRNGLLVPERDAVVLAQVMETLLRHPDLRQRLGKAGRESVLAQFGLAQNVGQVKGWLLRAVQNPRRLEVSVLAGLLTDAAS